MKSKLIEVVRQLKELDIEAQEYMKRVPIDLTEALFDNTYVNSKSQAYDVLVHALFGSMSADIFWFLYEWEPGSKEVQIILVDGTRITLESEEDYYKYLKEYC